MPKLSSFVCSACPSNNGRSFCSSFAAVIADRGHAETYVIDNDHTSLVFAVSHSGLSYTYGRFNQCAGEISIGETDEDQSFAFSVDAASIDTNNQLRDDHLKGPDFFDVQAFPEIKFRSTKLSSRWRYVRS